MQHVKLNEIATMAISADERAFFVQLGTHIAERRKAQGITQIQMAEALGVSQQTVNSYEVARRRVPASALPTLATLFSTSIDELMGKSDNATKGKRGPASTLQRKIDQVSQLPKAKQKFVIEMLDTVLNQQAAS